MKSEENNKREDKRKSNKSTYWVLFELLWRDYFRFFAMKHGRKILSTTRGGTTSSMTKMVRIIGL